MKKTTAPQTTTAPDMRKEFRKELTALGKKKKFLVRSQAAISKIETAAVREMRALRKADAKLDAGLNKEIAIIAKRQAILVGRLS